MAGKKVRNAYGKESLRWSLRLDHPHLCTKSRFFSYSGSTKPFTNSSHRKKDLDVDLFTISVDTSVILPMDERTCFLIGVKAQWLSLDGSIKSKARDAASIIAARERFDKKADIDVSLVQAYVGITF